MPMSGSKGRWNVPHDPRRRDRVIQEYKRLEDEFLELAEYIPLAPDMRFRNYRISSFRTGAFGVDCCTWLETLFEYLLMDARLNLCKGIERIRNSPKRGINVYRSVFEKELSFSERYGSLKYFWGSKIRPFKQWKKGKNPEWWRLYSRFKHERFALGEKFTMGHALESFTALSIVVSIWIPLDNPHDRENNSRVFSLLR
jgi:hypothetical protein